MFTILAVVLIVGIVLALFDIPENFKKLAYVIVAVFVILWLAQVLGISGGHLPQLR